MFNSKSKKPTVQSLGEETSSVLSVFRKAITDLTKINERAEAERLAKIAEAEQAQQDAESLKTLCEDNGAVITNINNLLNKQ